MARPQFVPLTLPEFQALVQDHPVRRRITAVHMHHTWRPRKRDYAGHATILSMWRYHTRQKGWSDIAQHATIAPDGTIWTGRSWEVPPASSVGHNGNSLAGPFMFEIVGDFDDGQEVLEGDQRDAAVALIVAIQRKHGLGADTLRFHRDLGSPKSCPGGGIDFTEFLDECRRAHSASPTPARSRGRAGRGAHERHPFERLDRVGAARRVLEQCGGSMEPADAEDDHGDRQRAVSVQWDGGIVERAPAVGRGDATLDAAALHALRPHVVNLTQGVFSSSGVFQTSKSDVDAIFDEHVPRALQQAKQDGEPLRLVFFAHGGLVGEAAGLGIATRQVEWWRRNGVYPVHFVWETGLGPTIAQLLRHSSERMPGVVSRDLADHTSDPLVEMAARALGGEKIWGGMKWSAARASEPGGGAHYVAERVAKLCAAHPADVQVHAAGHSAGSIFHAHFIPAALTAGVPRFESLHLLAPAVRVDVFLDQLAPRVGQGIGQLTMYTMARDWERRDHVAGIYRKSLLYLVSRALEPNGTTPILGLEECVRGDALCRALFGLGTPAPGPVTVIWSRTEAGEGLSASRSTTHGGFDDDTSTMNSVLRRVLGLGDLDPIESFVGDGRGRAFAESEWPPELEWATRLGAEGVAAASTVTVVPASASPGTTATAPSAPARPAPTSTGSGARVALCVGIDEYATAPLLGCVADARRWKSTLERLGFAPVVLLTNEEATRNGILTALGTLVRGRRAGDVAVFQYSGHGTRLPDIDGDELDDHEDEALCPFDLDQGRFVLDDDLREALLEFPGGVNLTCFFDCCHSGTVTRLVRPGAVAAARERGSQVRRRYLRATDAMIAAHRSFRRAQPAPAGLARGRAPGGSTPDMKEIVFTACRADEVAYESDGQGDFTRVVTELLDASSAEESHADFHARILRRFGRGARQEPQLNCADASRALRLLQPLR
jgi:hypothetical protein